jgi:glucan phosphoethanolaminetransferase (alkaline phosphatase superfamily)
MTWVLYSPQAFSIIMKVGLIAPTIILIFLAINNWLLLNWFWAILLTVFSVAACYNVYKFRYLFKTDVNHTIASFVWKMPNYDYNKEDTNGITTKHNGQGTEGKSGTN